MKPKHSPSPDLNIKDLIDIPGLQNLTDSFSRLTGISSAILSLEGEVLTTSGWQTICTDFHRKYPGTAKRCLESDTVLAGQVASGEKCTLYKCKNGLVDIATPIVIDDMHIGNLFTGQFFIDPPDIDIFARQAEEFGFDKTSYLETLAKVPIFSVERIQQAMNFLIDLTVIIGNMGKDKLELFALNKHLEQRIEERTSELRAEIQVRKKAEFELQQSKAFLDSVFDAIQDGISVLDQDLRILQVNKTICRWYPQLPASIGEKCYTIYHGRSKPCKKCPALRAIVSGKMEMEEVPYTIDGDAVGTQELFSFPMLDGAGKVKGVVEYVRDITKRKLAEEQIKIEKKFSESLINSLPGIMYVFDRSGRFLRWNKNFEEVSGHPANQIKKMVPLDFIALEDRARVKRSIEKVFREGDADIEAGFITGKEEAIPYLLTGYRFIQGERNYLIGIGIDISDRIEAEKEKEELIEKLRETLSQVKQLSGLLPICALCKKIRDDKGYWNQIESYIKKHSEANFSHGLCPDCAKKLYPDLNLWNSTESE